MKRIICILLLLAVTPVITVAQTLSPDTRKAIIRREFLRSFHEKTGTTPDKLHEARVFRIQNNDIKAEVPVPQGGWEQLVSKSLNAECELHAAINPVDTNNLVVGAMAYSGAGSLAFPIYFTKDLGKTWKKAAFSDQPFAGSLRLGGGDPMFTYNVDGSLLYMTWIDLSIRGGSFDTIHATIYYATSSNGGQNWKSSKTQTLVSSALVTGGGTQDGLFPDKEWLVCDRSNSPHRGTIYGSFLFFSDVDVTLNVARKTPTDSGFSAPVKLDLGPIAVLQIASLDVDNIGNLHVTFHGSEDGEIFNIYHCVSTDGGKTFSVPQVISRAELVGTSYTSVDYMIPGLADRQVPSVQVACGRGEDHSNNVYCVWDGLGIDENLNNGSDVYFARSTDGGATWSVPIVVNADPRGVEVQQYRSTMSVNDRGVISIGWYDGRGSESNDVVNYYSAFSLDGGKTFVAEQSVTTKPMDFTTVGLKNGEFGVGEYMQIVSTPNIAIPIWSDGRKGTGDLDIYAALVPIADQVLGVKSISNVEAGITLESIQPNPARDNVKVIIALNESQEVTISMLDMLGVERSLPITYKLLAGSNVLSHQLPDVPSGNYILRITSANGTVSTQVHVMK